jgi:hydroxymethylpyrimidine pyrophosphatase-like HAD family hydrolase
LFDAVVAENGGLLYWPAAGQEFILGHKPIPKLVRELKAQKVKPLKLGRVVISSDMGWHEVLRDTIFKLGVPYTIHLNGPERMLLPVAIDKGTGLLALLERLQIASADVVGVGDAENDQPFLHACGLGVAVANAVKTVRQQAILVTKAKRGAGVCELIASLLPERSER